MNERLSKFHDCSTQTDYFITENKRRKTITGCNLEEESKIILKCDMTPEEINEAKVVLEKDIRKRSMQKMEARKLISPLHSNGVKIKEWYI